jgi:uncharacterized protein YaeQ
MALGSTIYKIELQISDLDRHYYQTHALTVAQHPSETAQRMMVRILAFALNAGERLEFTKGLSTDEVPDLWQKALTGDIEHWIEVGQPSAKRIKKACNRSDRVTVYTFSGHSAEVWWQQNQKDFVRLSKLNIVDLPHTQISNLGDDVARTASYQCTIQEGLIWFGDAHRSCEITPKVLQGSISAGLRI